MARCERRRFCRSGAVRCQQIHLRRMLLLLGGCSLGRRVRQVHWSVVLVALALLGTVSPAMAARRARREAANEEPAPAAPLLALPGPAFPHMSFDPGWPELMGIICVSAPVSSLHASLHFHLPSWPADTDDTAAFAIHGRRLVLQPAGGAASLEGEAHTVQTAGSVWDCSVVLAKLLEMHLAPGPSASSLEPQLLPVADRPLTILELGGCIQCIAAGSVITYLSVRND